jgi:gamma-glutamylcyclotransferase (GGCT)/AIG2-like uncharacterized protein YtfP
LWDKSNNSISLYSEHTPAILRGFRLSFDLHAMALVEPAFANVREEDGAEVHGVAFCMDAENVAKLDSVERGYNKKMITLEAYDGRQLHGFVYVSKRELESTQEWAPSARYLGVLVKGNTVGNSNMDNVCHCAMHGKSNAGQ